MANPFAHIELSTDDLSAAKKFYKRVFDWKLSDMPQMSYTMIDVGKGTGGGMQGKMSPEQPTAWLPYVEVDDIKKSMAKAVKAGATALLELPGDRRDGRHRHLQRPDRRDHRHLGGGAEAEEGARQEGAPRRHRPKRPRRRRPPRKRSSAPPARSRRAAAIARMPRETPSSATLRDHP